MVNYLDLFLLIDYQTYGFSESQNHHLSCEFVCDPFLNLAADLFL